MAPQKGADFFKHFWPQREFESLGPIFNNVRKAIDHPSTHKRPCHAANHPFPSPRPKCHPRCRLCRIKALQHMAGARDGTQRQCTNRSTTRGPVLANAHAHPHSPSTDHHKIKQNEPSERKKPKPLSVCLLSCLSFFGLPAAAEGDAAPSRSKTKTMQDDGAPRRPGIYPPVKRRRLLRPGLPPLGVGF